MQIKRERLHFTDYGMLDWLDPDEYYYKGRWIYVGYAEGSDGNEYTLVRHEYDMEMRYTKI